TDPNDTPADDLLAVVITTLPPATDGVLELDGSAVTALQVVTVADINDGDLTFEAATNVTGNGRGAFTFQVRDDGGTTNGGIDTDQSPNHFSFNITNLNDAPAGTDATKTVLEDGIYTLAASDFGF